MTQDALFQAGMQADAVLSPDRVYRYALWRRWDEELPGVLFVGLNPSTANETTDDPTIRRCVRFARDWGYGWIAMANLYAYRATKPVVLHAAVAAGRDVVGCHTDEHLVELAASACLVVAAWGSDTGPFGRRAEDVMGLLGPDVRCLGLALNGQPRHPLYMPSASVPLPFELPRSA